MAEQPLVNRVAQSGIITFNLEQYYPNEPITSFDLKEYLFQGLILREKEFRQALKEHDWTKYTDQIVCIHCSTDAIIPTWAYMLVTKHVRDHAYRVFVGTSEEFLKLHYHHVISKLPISEYENGRIVIKGCSNRPVPPAAYAMITDKLQPVAKSIMYGEPCSTVPIYKKPLKRIR